MLINRLSICTCLAVVHLSSKQTLHKYSWQFQVPLTEFCALDKWPFGILNVYRLSWWSPKDVAFSTFIGLAGGPQKTWHSQRLSGLAGGPQKTWHSQCLSGLAGGPQKTYIKKLVKIV